MITMRSFNHALLLLSLLLFQKQTDAQDKPAPLPLMIPPSPNAAALGEYGKVPVGLFTGTVQQNIPLYTIETNAFSLPISLNYQSNGIKVSDVGSNVGLGWVLDAAGVITRTVNDETDEYSSTKTTLPAVGFDTQQMSDYLKQATSNNDWDSEPDLFAFNIPGYSGKFYLAGTAGNMQAVLISPAPLKIVFKPDFYTSTLGTEQIVITDPTGIEYTFGGTNAIEQSDSKTYGSGSAADNPQSKLVKTAWHLTKVKLLNGELVTFTYTGQLLKYDAGISQTVSASVSFKSSTGFKVQNAIHALPKISAVNVQASRLTEINWKGGRVALNYSLRFTGGITYLEKVDNVVIYAKSGSTFPILKKYVFNYLTVNTGFGNPDNLNGSYLDASKRLFLSDVITQSATGNELSRYTFEYYNPTELPNRFTYAQDYWGYFNGKVLNTDLVTNNVFLYNPDYYQASGTFSGDMIKQLFHYVGGDKSPDAQFAVKGMLKKITYPTGGYSSFEYESHSTGKFEDVLPAKTGVLLYGSKPVGTNEPLSVTTPVIPFEQKRVELFPSISASGCITSPQSVSFKITIKEIQSNTNVALEEYYEGGYISKATPYSPQYNDLYPGNGQAPLKRYFFTFQAGKSYTISISLTAATCTDAYGDLRSSYYAQPTTYQWVNTPVGGMRISKITTSDLTGNEQIKRYYYGSDFNTLTRSTGKTRIVEPAINYYETLTQVQNNDVWEDYRSLMASLNSAPLHDMYDAQGYHISYATVIEGEGNNIEGGATIHNFNSVTEISPVHYRDPVMGTPFENVFGNGDEIKTTTYKNVGVFAKVKEINRSYTNDSRIVSSVAAFKASKRSLSYINASETYNLSTYNIKSQWRYLSGISEINYDQAGSAVTTTYEYNNPAHMQLSTTTTVMENAGTANQRSFVTKYSYPLDYTYPGTLSGSAAVMKSMVDKNIKSKRVEELKYTLIGTSYRLTGGTLSTYRANLSSIVKDKDYALKLNNSTIYHDLVTLTPSTVNSSGQLTYDSHYEQLNAYSRYNGVDNLLEVADRKLTTAVILQPNTEVVWARTENSTFASMAYSSFEHDAALVSSFTNWNYNVANINTANYHSGTRSYNLSGANITTALSLTASLKYKVSLWRKVGSGTTLTLTAGSALTQTLGPQRNGWQYVEATFTGATSLIISGNYMIDELRLCPVNARMNTFVYKDGVGVISQCTENNKHTFFEYDEFNRLKLVRDQDNNILKKNEYNYQYIQN
jgi:hypothetical protein